MGGTLLRCLPEFPALALRGASTAPGSGLEGRDAGDAAGLGALGVPLSVRPETAVAGAAVAVDFTLAEAVPANAAACAANGTALVCGVTGLDEAGHAALRWAAESVPVLWAPNMSVGVAVLERLVRLAAAALPDFDAACSRSIMRRSATRPPAPRWHWGARWPWRGASVPWTRNRAGPGPRSAMPACGPAT
jgi:4-hydroxy-tetrahydrodipicolinate reductase